VLADYEQAPIDDAHRALFRLVALICADSTQVDQAAVDAAKAAGWDDEALYDAITVCALFQFVEPVDVLLHLEQPVAEAAGHVEAAVAVDPAAVTKRDLHLAFRQEFAVEPGQALVRSG
jgi:hypothetical protein